MEGDAGAGPLNSGEAEDPTASEPGIDSTDTAVVEVSTRLGGRWVLAICTTLLLMAAALGVGGYFGLRYHRESEQLARDNAAAVAAAKDCVLATQAPDVTDMATAERKIFDCSTGEFRHQYMVYSGVYVQAYRAAQVKVQVSELRAAVERDNNDGSVDVLVALRIKADNVEAQGREFGYRLRAQMARDNGAYRIAKLDQVAR